MDKKAGNFFLRLIFAIILIFLLIIIGYLVGGIMGYPKMIEADVPLEESIVAVLSDPFRDWSNEFTPVTITLALVIGEFITFIVMAVSAKKSRTEEAVDINDDAIEKDTSEIEKEVVSQTVNKQLESYLTEKVEEEIMPEEVETPSANNLFNDFFSIDVSEEISDDDETQEVEMDEASKFLDEYEGINDSLMDLVGEYSPDQLKAMSQIYNYLPDLTEKEVKKMFGPEKTAEEISEYIEVLFE